MRKRKQTHVLRFRDRVAALVITESENHVLFDFKLSTFEWSREEDREEFRQWFKPQFDRYENDRRPLVVSHPCTGEIIVMEGPSRMTVTVFPPAVPKLR